MNGLPHRARRIAAVLSIATAGLVAAAPASANEAAPGGGGGYCAAEFQSCEGGGTTWDDPGYYGGGGWDFGGGGGGYYDDGGEDVADPDPDPDRGCGGSRRYVINGHAWIRKGECASRLICLGKAQDVNQYAEANGSPLRAVCGAATDPFGGGSWLWVTIP